MRKNKNEREQSIFQKYDDSTAATNCNTLNSGKGFREAYCSWKSYEGTFKAMQEQFEEHLEERIKQATAQQIIKLEKLHEQQPEQLE